MFKEESVSYFNKLINNNATRNKLALLQKVVNNLGFNRFRNAHKVGDMFLDVALAKYIKVRNFCIVCVRMHLL